MNRAIAKRIARELQGKEGGGWTVHPSGCRSFLSQMVGMMKSIAHNYVFRKGGFHEDRYLYTCPTHEV